MRKYSRNIICALSIVALFGALLIVKHVYIQDQAVAETMQSTPPINLRAAVDERIAKRAALDSTRSGYARQAKYHMYTAKTYRDNSFHIDIIDSGAQVEYMMKAMYHAAMAGNYLKLLDLASSEKHSIDTETRSVLEDIL